MQLSRPFGAVLMAASEELTELAALADSIGASTLDPVERLQPLDRLSQHLAGLARFFTAVQAVVPPVTADIGLALGTVPVGALADRLAGRIAVADTDPGHLELF